MTDVPRAPGAGAAAIAGYAPKVNRDYTIYPTIGALAAAGRTPRLFPQGQTAAPAETTRHYAPKVGLSGAVTVSQLTKTLTLYDLVGNCLAGMGFVPGGVTVVGFMVNSADLDSGTPAIVQAIYLGSTAMVTGITTGQGGTSGIYACVPTAVTESTAVYLKTTTEPATAVSGAVTVMPIYYS